LAWTLLPFKGTSLNGLGERFEEGDAIMLWTILVILLVLWLIGLLSNVGGSLIHLLLVVAVVVLIINLVTGRRAV
jgi:fatty acid desaturase